MIVLIRQIPHAVQLFSCYILFQYVVITWIFCLAFCRPAFVLFCCVALCCVVSCCLALCCVVSCLVSCRVVLRCVVLCCVVSCASRRVVLCCVLSCPVLSCHVLSCRVVLRCVALLCVVLRLVLSRHVVLCCVLLYLRSVEFVSESQVSSISDTPFGMHNLVLDIFPFSNKVLLKCYLGQFKCY